MQADIIEFHRFPPEQVFQLHLADFGNRHLARQHVFQAGYGEYRQPSLDGQFNGTAALP